ncbi:MAG: hypothetical protein NWQ45_07595 [Congregibacter sp.]|nr:hypothetical protein [Congregibacter sp.]
MTKRLASLNPYQFTAFCLVVLEESDRRGDVIDTEELYDLALAASQESLPIAEALCERFRGFIEMSFHPEAQQYVSNDAGQMRFHPALFEAAASARSRKNGSFPNRPFFKRVAELAANKYRDFDFHT